MGFARDRIGPCGGTCVETWAGPCAGACRWACPGVLVVVEFMANVPPHHSAATARPTGPARLTCAYMGMTVWGSRSGRPIMEEGIDAPGGFSADALDLHEIG